MRYVVSRIRHVLESTVVEAGSSADATTKARKLKRTDWIHLESKRRRGYQAKEVDINTTARG